MLKSKSLWACFILMVLLLQGSIVTTYAKPIHGYSDSAQIHALEKEESSVQILSGNGQQTFNPDETSDYALVSDNSPATNEVSGPGEASAFREASGLGNVSAFSEAFGLGEASAPSEASGLGEASAPSEASGLGETSAPSEASPEPERKEESLPSQTEASQEDKTASVQPKSLGTFRTTGYCPCSRCSGKWGKRTSTGAIPRSGHTVAVDPRVIPYGTKLMINGTVYTAEDCGGGVRGKHIDIYYDTHSQAYRHGSRSAEVFLIPN